MTVATEKIFIIKPQAATNINTNPSFELGTTGYTTGGTNTIARSSTVQRHGVYSCLCTYQDNDTLLSYAATLTAVASYVAAISIYIPTAYDGTDLRLNFSAFVGASYTECDIDMTIRDKWQRVYAKITTAAMDLAGFLLLIENGVNSTAGRFVYVDAVQIELGSVPTTFIDPNNTEKINKIMQYGWNGSPNASTSYRLGTTRSGGLPVNIADYCGKIDVVGLGIAPIQTRSIELTDGTKRYQGSDPTSRRFSLNVYFKSTDIGGVQTNRNALTNLVKPDGVPGNQLITMLYEGYDSTGAITTDTLEIKCTYLSGLDKAMQRDFERANVFFEMPDAYIQSAADTGSVLGYQLAVADANNIIKRSSSGIYSKLGAAGLSAFIYKIIEGPDGKIYICGNFTNAGGSGANYITVYDPVTDTFDDLGTSPDAIVNDIIFDAKGNLWACGNFANIGGSAIAKIAYMTVGTTTWNALGTGLNNNGKAMAFDMYGNLFVTGEFTAAGGVANTAYIAYWDGSAWKAIGTGLQARGLGIAINKNNQGIVVGTFTDAGGVANTSRIAFFTTTGFLSLGSADANATGVAVDNDGNFFVVGSFTTIGGISYQYFSKYVIGSGWENSGLTFNGTGILYVSYDKETNKVYFMGDYTTINGITVPDKTIEYVSYGVFRPLDVDLPAAGIAASLLTSKNGTLYIGHSASGTAYGSTATTRVVTSAKSYPIIVVTGPGSLWQIKNYSNGKAIYFKDLTLLDGEVITIDLRPGKTTMESSFRGSVLSYVLPGADYDFELLPGTNYISAFLYGSTTAESGISATWRQNYHSIDGAQL